MPKFDFILGICPTCQEPQAIRRSPFAGLFEGLLKPGEKTDEASAYIIAEHDFMEDGPRCEGSGQTPQAIVS